MVLMLPASRVLFLCVLKVGQEGNRDSTKNARAVIVSGG